MNTNRSTTSSDSSEWQSYLPRHASIGSSSQNSETESILISYLSPLTSPTAPSPPVNSLSNNSSRILDTVTNDRTTHLTLNPAVTISFIQGQRLFKLRFTQIDIYRNAAGDLKSIELSDYTSIAGILVHGFPNSRQAIPHLEQPAESKKAALRVSFFGTQTLQTAQNLFAAEPDYTFEDEQDCVRFQEALLNQQVVLIAGVAEVKSKGRGEECISQNLRVLRAPNGAFSVFFFANSQRREKKRYVSIPLHSVDRIDPGKKGSKAISVRLRPNFELLSQLKVLQIKFLEEHDYRTFYSILCQVVGLHGD